MSVQMALQAAQLMAQFGGNMGDSAAWIFGPIAGFAAEKTKKELRRLDDFNKQVTKNTTTALFDLERQRVSERMRTVQALGSYQAQRSTALSSLKAQYGAMDVIGASADAMKQAYSYQVDQAMAQEDFNFEVGIDNYNIDVMGVVNQGLTQLRYTMEGNPSTMTPQQISGLVNAGKGMFNRGGGNYNVGGQGGILGTGSGGGYSGTTMDTGISNVNWGGGGSLGIA